MSDGKHDDAGGHSPGASNGTPDALSWLKKMLGIPPAKQVKVLPLKVIPVTPEQVEKFLAGIPEKLKEAEATGVVGAPACGSPPAAQSGPERERPPESGSGPPPAAGGVTSRPPALCPGCHCEVFRITRALVRRKPIDVPFEVMPTEFEELERAIRRVEAVVKRRGKEFRMGEYNVLATAGNVMYELVKGALELATANARDKGELERWTPRKD